MRTPEIYKIQKPSGGDVEVANIAMSPGNFVLQFVSFSLQQARRNVSLSKGWWPYATLFAYFFFSFYVTVIFIYNIC